MTKEKAINIFGVIRDIKNSNLSREALTAYIMLRIKLKALFDEFEKAREEISEQVKPKDWEQSDGMTEWDANFKPVMQKWLDEEIDIETKIFNHKDISDLISSNPDKGGLFVDAIVEGLLK